MTIDAAQRKDLDDQIARDLLRLYRFQHDDGSFGWTETDPYHDLWMTSDAAYAIGYAKAAGYTVNDDAYQNALKDVTELVKEWGVREPHSLYWGDLHPLSMASLALWQGGDTDGTKAALTQLETVWLNHPKDVSNTDMAVAAVVYPSLGAAGKARSDQLIAQLWASRRRTGALASWTEETPPPQFEQAPSDASTTAWALYALETLHPNDPQNDAVARWLMANRSGDHWELYDTTSFTLMALTEYLRQDREMAPNFTATVLVNGHALTPTTFTPKLVDEPDVVVDVPPSLLVTGKNAVSLRKEGQGRLFYSLDLREATPEPKPKPTPGFWQRVATRLWRPETTLEQLDSSGYRIKRVYLRNTSRRNFWWEDTVPAPGTDYNRQDTVLVRLIIDCVRPGSHVIVEEPIPAGCTVTDVSGDEEEDWNNWWSSTDVRDDKIVFFINEITRGRSEIDYHLQASTPGTFDAMPTQITGTFDPTLRSKGHAARVTVANDQ